ncbi:hypothetical protein [Psychroserpens luteolus]|uniref:hypothetical protein n=1 Tax=Psychroserpens luteolus TaxID=2855840 RepID=UPI001E501821|nr:hypothetical protein [Psychroserpens luteolus]MCD2258686.1 hypothetical protein [Psychroserpens luteolus]
MKKLILLVPCLLVLVLMSCDRRTSKKERLENAVSDFNKNFKIESLKSYYPETYTEIKTDSVISNTFLVSIKNYTSMDSEIPVHSLSKNSTELTKYHRVFESDILVAVSDKIIYEKHISAEEFRDYSNSEFWKNATLEHIWIDQDASNTTTLALGISFVNPNNKAYKFYEMLIDKNGKERLTLIEDHS